MLQKEACPSCSAPVTFDPEARQVACPYCGSALTPVAEHGTVSLAFADEGRTAMEETSAATRSAIADSGQAVQEAVTETGQATQKQLQVMQLRQDLNAANAELASVQRELRQLRTGKRNRSVRKEIKQLEADERALAKRIQDTKRELDSAAGAKAYVSNAETDLPIGLGKWSLAIVLFILVTAAVGTISTAIGIPVGGGALLAAVVGAIAAIRVLGI
jgi:DNA repair exonuclease SbcCD ATPase subunit